VKPKAPPELLEEMFEIQERCRTATRRTNPMGLSPCARAALAGQRDRLQARSRTKSPAPGAACEAGTPETQWTGRAPSRDSGGAGHAGIPRTGDDDIDRHWESWGGPCLASSALIWEDQ